MTPNDSVLQRPRVNKAPPRAGPEVQHAAQGGACQVSAAACSNRVLGIIWRPRPVSLHFVSRRNRVKLGRDSQKWAANAGRIVASKSNVDAALMSRCHVPSELQIDSRRALERMVRDHRAPIAAAMSSALARTRPADFPDSISVFKSHRTIEKPSVVFTICSTKSSPAEPCASTATFVLPSECAENVSRVFEPSDQLNAITAPGSNSVTVIVSATPGTMKRQVTLAALERCPLAALSQNCVILSGWANASNATLGWQVISCETFTTKLVISGLQDVAGARRVFGAA